MRTIEHVESPADEPPYNVSDGEIREWMESRGIVTKSIRVVRDLVTGASPSFGHVELKNRNVVKEVISILDGKKMRNQTVRVKMDPAYPSPNRS